MRRDSLKSFADPTSAAEWFVRLDGAPADEVTDARFAVWLDRAAEHDAELRRCDAAAGLVRALADDPELRWAYEEAAGLAAPRSGVQRGRHAALAWRIAAAVAAVGAVLLVLNEWPSRRARPRSPIAAAVVANPSPDAAVAVLAGHVVVAAQSVAVLPFVAAGAATGDEPVSADSRAVAAGLQRQLVAELGAVPGLYVVNPASVQPYAGSDLAATEIGAQLGARGVLGATVALEGGRVHVGVQLVDAATARVLWSAGYERPVDELRAIELDVVLQVIAALAFDPTMMRVAASRPDTSNALASVPLQSGAPE